MASKTITEAIDAIAATGGVTQSSDSIAAAIDGLDGLVVSDGAAAVTNALKPEGAITVAIGDAIDEAIDDSPKGDAYAMAEDVAAAAITAALAPTGDIAEAIDAAVDAVTAEYDAPNETVTELAELEANYDALVLALVEAGVITLPAAL